MSETNDNNNKSSESVTNQSAASTPAATPTATSDNSNSENSGSNTNKKSFLPTLQKASGLKPPTTLSISTTNLNTTSASGISRIGRPCQGHTTPKAGIPPLPESKQESNSILSANLIMRRQSDEFSRSQLADVDEECEADLTMERRNNFSRSSRTPEMNYVTSKPPKPSDSNRKYSISSEHYLEATGRRRSSDQGVVLTTDTDSFIIGQKVWVGGIRPGQIAYIGETHFAPGEWAGVVLDEPNGKNDGCVSGKRYFQCEPKKGIFSRLTRLTHEPLAGVTSGDVSPLDQSMRSLTSPSRSTTASPPGSVRSVTPRSKINMAIGDRVIVSSGLGSRPGLLKFIGETKFAPGTWCGVQLDEPNGKNDGSVDSVSYFECPPKYGIFVPLAKVTLSPSAKINRLSRSGSKESLLSVGTVGSVQSTTTSRMRMSAQRLSTPMSTKPLTSQKTTFSLQDVLREKQNHIEQLLIERDLERQESENQVFMYQKDISQLKNKIISLERDLIDERKRTEDLQFSIDEATFCKEESNENSKSNLTDDAQTIEYKSKIEQLEKQLRGASPILKDSLPNAVPDFDHDAFHKEMDQLRAELNRKDAIIQQSEIVQKTIENEIIVLKEKQVEAAKTLELKVDGLSVSEQALQDEIVYLKTQGDDLRMELNERNEAMEKQYLSIKDIERTFKEELDLAQFELKEKTTIIEEHEKEIVKLKALEADILAKDNELGQNELLINALQSELKELNLLSTSIKSEKEELNNNAKRLADEKHLVENELEVLKNSSTDISSEVLKLSNELRARDENYQKLYNESQSLKTQLETNIRELQGSLNVKSDELNKIKSESDGQVQNLQKELEATRESREKVLNELSGKMKDLENLTTALNELNGKVEERDTKMAQLTKNYSQLELDMGDVQRKYESSQVKLSQILEQKENAEKELEQTKTVSLGSNSEVSRLSGELKGKQDAYNQLFDESNNAKLQLEKQIHELQQNMSSRTNEIEQLNINIAEILAQKSILDSDFASVRETAENDRKSLRNEIEAIKSEKELLLNQFNEKLKENEKQTTTISEISSKLEVNEIKLNELSKTYSKLELDYGDISRKAETTEAKLNQVLVQKESVETELAALRNSSLDINSEISRLSTELKSKQNEYNQLFDKMNNVKQNLEKEIQEVKQNLNLKTQEFDQLQTQYNELLSIKLKLEEELAQTRVSTESERASLKNQFETVQLQKDTLLNEFNSKLQENQALLVQIAELTTRLETTENKLNEITKTYSKLELEHGDLSRKAESNEIKLNQIVEQKQTIENELESMKSSSYDSNAEMLRISSELKAKQLAYNQLFDSTNESQLKLGKEIHEAEQNLTLKSQECEVLRNENENLTKSKLELSSELENLRTTLDIERGAIKMETEQASIRTKQLTEELQTKYTTLQSQHDELQAKHESSEAQLKELTEQKLAVERDLESIRNNSFDSNVELTRISDELKVKDESYTKLLDESVRIKNELEKRITELQSTLNSKVTEIEELSKLKIKNENELNNELIQLKEISDNEKVQLHVELETLRSDKEKLVLEINQMLANSDVRKTEINSSISQLETQISELSKELDISKVKLAESTKTSEEVIHELKQTEARLKESLRQTEEQLNDEKQRLEKELVLKSEKLQLLQDENVDIVNKNSELLNKINLSDDMKNELLTKQQEISNLTENVKKYESYVATLENDNKKLKISERELSHLKLVLNQKDLDLKATKDRVLAQANTNFEDDTMVQIAFLNSIIADMQKKNESLNEKLALLESGITNAAAPQNLFEMPGRRKPAPRLYCDICDEFDSHDTEDCPLQSSESPTSSVPTRDPNAERIIPPPRKYCELCEVFGHDIGECENDEMTF